MLPEAFPGLLAATTVTAIALVSYAAMSGVTVAVVWVIWPSGSAGAPGGRDVVAVRLLVLVQLIQAFGDRLVHLGHEELNAVDGSQPVFPISHCCGEQMTDFRC